MNIFGRIWKKEKEIKYYNPNSWQTHSWVWWQDTYLRYRFIFLSVFCLLWSRQITGSVLMSLGRQGSRVYEVKAVWRRWRWQKQGGFPSNWRVPWRVLWTWSRAAGPFPLPLAVLRAPLGPQRTWATSPSKAFPKQAWWGRNKDTRGLRAWGSGILSGNPEGTNVLLPERPPLCRNPVSCLRTRAQTLNGKRENPRMTKAEFLTNTAGWKLRGEIQLINKKNKEMKYLYFLNTWLYG